MTQKSSSFGFGIFFFFLVLDTYIHTEKSQNHVQAVIQVTFQFFFVFSIMLLSFQKER